MDKNIDMSTIFKMVFNEVQIKMQSPLGQKYRLITMGMTKDPQKKGISIFVTDSGIAEDRKIFDLMLDSYFVKMNVAEIYETISEEEIHEVEKTMDKNILYNFQTTKKEDGKVIITDYRKKRRYVHHPDITPREISEPDLITIQKYYETIILEVTKKRTELPESYKKWISKRIEVKTQAQMEGITIYLKKDAPDEILKNLKAIFYSYFIDIKILYSGGDETDYR